MDRNNWGETECASWTMLPHSMPCDDSSHIWEKRWSGEAAFREQKTTRLLVSHSQEIIYISDNRYRLTKYSSKPLFIHIFICLLFYCLRTLHTSCFITFFLETRGSPLSIPTMRKRRYSWLSSLSIISVSKRELDNLVPESASDPPKRGRSQFNTLK